jgi:hypothetical protein
MIVLPCVVSERRRRCAAMCGRRWLRFRKCAEATTPFVLSSSRGDAHQQ